jgi:acyl-CoA thioesterase
MHNSTRALNLSTLLGIEQVRLDSYRGHGQAGAPRRIFGGQIAAQSLRAAGETAGESRVMHSMHSYFLRPGDPSVPVVYRVERLRDGMTYATRRVTATQRRKDIFTLTASFKRQEVTSDRQPRMGPVPLPESLPDPYVQQGIHSLADHQRAPWWKLGCFEQALLVLAHLRKNETFAQVGAGFGVSRRRPRGGTSARHSRSSPRGRQACARHWSAWVRATS